MTGVFNDNDVASPAMPPPGSTQGQAAILLVESLLHALVDKSVITVADAIGIVDVASDVVAEMADAQGDVSAPLQASQTLLAAISESLKSDL